jgi:hypothetical protein
VRLTILDSIEMLTASGRSTMIGGSIVPQTLHSARRSPFPVLASDCGTLTLIKFYSGAVVNAAYRTRWSGAQQSPAGAESSARVAAALYRSVEKR